MKRFNFKTQKTNFIVNNINLCVPHRSLCNCQRSKGFPGGSAGKESACKVGDLGLIPGLGRSPGEGKGYLLQYSGLENSMDCIVHGVAKSRTRLSDFRFPSLSGDDGCRGDAEHPSFAPDLCLCSGLLRSGSWVFGFLFLF